MGIAGPYMTAVAHIEPDKQISRIRLSDKTSRFAFACDAICSF